MDIQIAKQRMLLFSPQMSMVDAKELAWKKKIDAFGAINKVTSFLSKPKDEEFELVYSEERYEPFWHVIAKSHYVYDRNSSYQVSVSSPEVRSVTLQKTSHEVTNGHIHIDVVEHCMQDEQEEVLVDGITGQQQKPLASYLKISAKEVIGDLAKAVTKGAILVPPQARVSAIMRDALSKMIHGIQADTIFEEQVEVTCVDLYYHPVFAFQYQWKNKGKEAIVEIDGVMGTITTGERTFQQYLGKVLDRDFLFDLGADAAGMFVPGGSIAVKVAKKYMDTKKK